MSEQIKAVCEQCLYYDFDEELGTEVCQMPMDQDEMSDWLSMEEKRCPYFRFYDEYKSVQRQN